jgi:TolB-like protein/class 3 adenylate cyclase
MTSERRLAAIMFTDLVGYSALTQQNEALAMELLEQHRSMLRPLFEKHSGREIKTTGDGFLIEFSSPLNAVNCAIEIQGNLHSHNLTAPEERKIDIRIGIHLGEVEERDGDIYGDGVNVAARIEPLAETGGICISDAVHPHISSKIRLPIESIGTPELKNIQASIEVFRIKLSWQETVDSVDSDAAAKSLDNKSIAVLPFANMSADPENEYFSDGITEDIITKLSKVSDLKVISRTSVMQYKGENRNLREIAIELGVGVVVEGSVRKAEDQVRVTAQLIDAESDEHLWAESYDRKLENIFDVQSDVAEKIVKALQASISEEEHQQLHQVQTENSEAYQLYLKGLKLWRNRSEENLIKSAEIFEQAIEIDPNYALAYIGLANALIVTKFKGPLPKNENFVRAAEFAQKALEIDPMLGDAYTSLAQIEASLNWDSKKAEAYYKKAIELNPNDATGYHWYGVDLDLLGRHEEAQVLYKKAMELSPLYIQVRLSNSYSLLSSGELDQAESELIAASKMDGDKSNWASWYSIFYRATRRYSDGLAFIHDAYERNLVEPGTMTLSEAVFYLGTGEHERAYKMLIEFMANPKTKDSIDTLVLADFLLMIGEKQTVLDILWKAYEERDPQVIWFKAAFVLRQLHDEPRYQELLEKIGWGMD